MVGGHLSRVKLGILLLVSGLTDLTSNWRQHFLSKDQLSELDIWKPPTAKPRRSFVTIVEQVCELVSVPPNLDSN